MGVILNNVKNMGNAIQDKSNILKNSSNIKLSQVNRLDSNTSELINAGGISLATASLPFILSGSINAKVISSFSSLS